MECESASVWTGSGSRSSPELKLAVEGAEGALTLSRAAFDLRLATALTAARTNLRDAKGAPAVQKDLIYVARADRLLRSGIIALLTLGLEGLASGEVPR